MSAASTSASAAKATLPNMAERLRHESRIGNLEEVIRIIDEEVPAFGVNSVNYRENGVSSISALFLPKKEREND